MTTSKPRDTRLVDQCEPCYWNGNSFPFWLYSEYEVERDSDGC
jgi:hypothetical protein